MWIFQLIRQDFSGLSAMIPDNKNGGGKYGQDSAQA
jgi:hypothetical protein